jgi:hypothetical protein
VHKDHNTNPTLAPKGKGISGGHNEKVFRDFLKEKGGEVTKEVKDPRYPGITHIKYRLPKLDTARNPIPGQFKESDKYVKTVYDPSKYSDDYVAKLSAEAGKKAVFVNEKQKEVDVVVDGLLFHVYKNPKTQKIDNAFLVGGVDT